MGMDEKLRRENPHDERINVPANPRHYWRYRMHITLEKLIREKQFNSELKQLITSGGRL
jgi:4-alpha-glucanotransferase